MALRDYIGAAIFMIVLVLLSSCQSKGYEKYHAFWYADVFLERDSPVAYIPTGWVLNVKGRSASIPTMYSSEELIEGLQMNYSKIKSAPFKLRSDHGKNYIKFIDHYFLDEELEIRCLNLECCELEMKSANFYILLKYRSDLDAYGSVSRRCE